jgi:hypothetical protein
MAKGIRDLTPISDGGHSVEPDTLFEGVTQFLDHAGIYARKIRADELEAYITREGSVVFIFIEDKINEEKERAEGAETAIALESEQNINAEIARAEAAEEILQKNKADVYVVAGPRRLMDAAVGANINYIKFNTAVSPVLEDSFIECSGGSFVVDNNEFYFRPASGSRVVFYTAGEWTAAAAYVFEAPGLTVTINYNANGGVWENHYGCHNVDLSELRDILHGEITAEKDRAEQEESTIKAAIPGTAAASVAAHNISASAHEDIRAATLPFPTTDGAYNLVVTDGAPSWELVT